MLTEKEPIRTVNIIDQQNSIERKRKATEPELVISPKRVRPLVPQRSRTLITSINQEMNTSDVLNF